MMLIPVSAVPYLLAIETEGKTSGTLLGGSFGPDPKGLVDDEVIPAAASEHLLGDFFSCTLGGDFDFLGLGWVYHCFYWEEGKEGLAGVATAVMRRRKRKKRWLVEERWWSSQKAH
ncbi:UNVERIFIED_CONTAM: hypothetical protein Sangu_1939800 [Sesamum angustifolium]|uniref:Uncharacterized protein n=1 Tax=Sesamum angustifolium TaxID=2727405 RepID=A0AAW2LVN5_9LAMI